MGKHLCIGGSLDGKKASAESRAFQIPVRVGNRFDRECYEAQRFTRGEGYPIVTFWVLTDLQDSSDASERALQLYDEAIRELDARTNA